MESLVSNIIANLSLPILFIIILATLYTLSKGADLLVDEAVVLSEELGIPKMIIGATIVSLGTTLPEASVSVMASISGDSSLALGNAVGSVICDTGLILGIAALISPLKIQKDVANRHGWIQFFAGLLLVLVSIPFTSLSSIFTNGGYISNLSGLLLIFLLIVYIYTSVRWAKNNKDENAVTAEFGGKIENKFMIFIKLALGVAIIIISSKILIPTVQETAVRLRVPNSVIAATLVAFGTSLPELVTSVTASIKGHGELAIGNVIGADILNVLFVVGFAAVFAKEGIYVTPDFFKLYFPAMIFVLTIFRLGTIFSKDKLRRSFGLILLLTYIVISMLSYL